MAEYISSPLKIPHSHFDIHDHILIYIYLLLESIKAYMPIEITFDKTYVQNGLKCWRDSKCIFVAFISNVYSGLNEKPLGILNRRTEESKGLYCWTTDGSTNVDGLAIKKKKSNSIFLRACSFFIRHYAKKFGGVSKTIVCSGLQTIRNNLDPLVKTAKYYTWALHSTSKSKNNKYVQLVFGLTSVL